MAHRPYPDGCAAAVVRLAADAGIALAPAGATHPYGRDQRDRTIRLAPTFPSLTDLEQAMRGPGYLRPSRC